MKTAVLIAYWSDDKSVSYVTMDDNESGRPPSRFETLHGRMQDRIVDGHITEILEYWPSWDGRDRNDVDKRISYWVEVLKGLGYELDL